jgi:hypothetical protein
MLKINAMVSNWKGEIMIKEKFVLHWDLTDLPELGHRTLELAKNRQGENIEARLINHPHLACLIIRIMRNGHTEESVISPELAATLFMKYVGD